MLMIGHVKLIVVRYYFVLFYFIIVLHYIYVKRVQCFTEIRLIQR